jgi:tRNA (cmo5U34)-methyltransferase
VTVGALFDEAAANYDRARRQLVPDLDAFYGAVVECVPFEREREIRVLDLGAGTGFLSAVVAESFPRSRVTLVDVSVEMLRVARRRFAKAFAGTPAGSAGRFDFRVMDFARKPLPKGMPASPGGYDLVVSALAIHHLTDGDKREVFEKAHDALRPGGYFVNADQVLGETPEEEARYGEWWLGRVRETGVSEVDLADALIRMRADRNATLGAQMGWLAEAGFEPVGCPYRNHRFAVYNGRKGSEKSGKRKEADE